MKAHAGFQFPDADRFMVGELKWDGTYQSQNYYKAMEFVKNRACAVDAGAHIGAWTKLMASDFQRVLSFEPSPDTFEALQANVQHFNLTNVEPFNIALGAEAGTVSMALDAKGEKLANTGARFIREGGSIPRRRLDDFEIPSCGFLKMDVEGSEPFILEGAAATIKRCKPIVLFENKRLWLTHFGLPKGAVVDLLTEYGYAHLASVKNDEVWGPRR